MRFPSRIFVPLFGVLLVAAAACHDATTRPRLVSPLVGQWELTTHFDTFSFETPAPSPPDCPGFTLYCTHLRTTTEGAYLGGVIEVRDTSTSSDSIATAVPATGTLQASFCDAIDYQNLTGCTHVNDRAAIEYNGSIAGAPDSSATATLAVVLAESGDIGFESRAMRSHDATFAGDSIYGHILWGFSTGRSPPTYRGTFVLHRVH